MRHMNWLIRGTLGLALAATASLALAGPHGPPLAGARPDVAPAYTPAYRDDMPGPDRQVGPRAGYDPYGFDRQGVTRDGFDIHGYDDLGYDRYGFDQGGYTRDGYDRFGYDERGLDRYGRRAPTRYGQAEPAPHGYADQDRDDDRDRYAERLGRADRYGPPPAGYGRDDRAYADQSNRADRYAPAPRDYWDEPADGYYVPSFGGPLQHYADPRCSTCRPSARRAPCGCEAGYSASSVSVGPGFFYDAGGVGPIPDGGGYGGGGGYVIVGGGSGAHASSNAYASSSSRVSVGVRVGGHGGGHGGCHSCGGHK
jgi:hypothetical protein